MNDSTPHMSRTVLWWGRFDPDYSRNRILRQCFAEMGWRIRDFHPKLSSTGDIEAYLRKQIPVDLVWVPCFRQRDVQAAARWARRRRIPLIFDPLISAYDKQVFDRAKFSKHSDAARRVLQKERKQFALADAVLADTDAHAAFFQETLGVPAAKIHVVAVGAEETLFTPQAWSGDAPPGEVLFFGSFIPLQGPEIIVEAARLYQGPPLRWCLVGNGPLRKVCEQRARDVSSIHFEDWLPYDDLPARIQRAAMVLGIFGATPKAGRVIPNKVYQAMACARPVVTMRSAAYPDELLSRTDGGIYWVDGGNARALADKVAELFAEPANLETAGKRARTSFDTYFSHTAVCSQLRSALAAVTPVPAPG